MMALLQQNDFRPAQVNLIFEIVEDNHDWYPISDQLLYDLNVVRC
jgi:hypothetical protein